MIIANYSSIVQKFLTYFPEFVTAVAITLVIVSSSYIDESIGRQNACSPEVYVGLIASVMSLVPRMSSVLIWVKHKNSRRELSLEFLLPFSISIPYVIALVFKTTNKYVLNALTTCQIIFGSYVLISGGEIKVFLRSKRSPIILFLFSVLIGLNALGCILCWWSEFNRLDSLSAAGATTHGLAAVLTTIHLVTECVISHKKYKQISIDVIGTTPPERGSSNTTMRRSISYLFMLVFQWTFSINSKNDFDAIIKTRIYCLIFLAAAIAQCDDARTGEMLKVTSCADASELTVDFFRSVSNELRSFISSLSLGLQILHDELEPNDTSKLTTVTDLQSTCEASSEVLNEIAIACEMRLGMIEVETELVHWNKAIKAAFRGQKENARKRGLGFEEVMEPAAAASAMGERLFVDVNQTDLSHAVRLLLRQVLRASESTGNSIRVNVGINHSSDIVDVGSGMGAGIVDRSRTTSVGDSATILRYPTPPSRFRCKTVKGDEILLEFMGYVQIDIISDSQLMNKDQLGMFDEEKFIGRDFVGRPLAFCLSIVRSLVARSRGTLNVYSHVADQGVGAGSTYSLRYPLYVVCDADHTSAQPSWLQRLLLSRHSRSISIGIDSPVDAHANNQSGHGMDKDSSYSMSSRDLFSHRSACGGSGASVLSGGSNECTVLRDDLLDLSLRRALPALLEVSESVEGSMVNNNLEKSIISNKSSLHGVSSPSYIDHLKPGSQKRVDSNFDSDADWRLSSTTHAVEILAGKDDAKSSYANTLVESSYANTVVESSYANTVVESMHTYRSGWATSTVDGDTVSVKSGKLGSFNRGNGGGSVGVGGGYLGPGGSVDGDAESVQSGSSSAMSKRRAKAGGNRLANGEDTALREILKDLSSRTNLSYTAIVIIHPNTGKLVELMEVMDKTDNQVDYLRKCMRAMKRGKVLDLAQRAFERNAIILGEVHREGSRGGGGGSSDNPVRGGSDDRRGSFDVSVNESKDQEEVHSTHGYRRPINLASSDCGIAPSSLMLTEVTSPIRDGNGSSDCVPIAALVALHRSSHSGTGFGREDEEALTRMCKSLQLLISVLLRQLFNVVTNVQGNSFQSVSSAGPDAASVMSGPISASGHLSASGHVSGPASSGSSELSGRMSTTALSSSLGILHCLVVDDVKVARKQLRMALEKSFASIVTVFEAVDGSDAVKVVTALGKKGISIDCIFMDCLMPIMDGPTAAKALRQSGYGAEIVGISGMITLAKNSFALANVHDVFEKPLSVQEVSRMVGVLLQIKSRAITIGPSACEDEVCERRHFSKLRLAQENTLQPTDTGSSSFDGLRAISSLDGVGAVDGGGSGGGSGGGGGGGGEISQRDCGVPEIQQAVVTATSRPTLRGNNQLSGSATTPSKRNTPLRQSRSAQLCDEPANHPFTLAQEAHAAGKSTTAVGGEDEVTVARQSGAFPRPFDHSSTDSYRAPEVPEGDHKFSFLVVDDVPSNRKVLVRLLHKLGQTTADAVDGIDAIEKYQHALKEGRPFDCIMMDSVMPHMDGPTAAKELRALGYTGPLFGVTGNVLARDVEHFVSCGADRVIAKPVKPETLVEVLKDMKEKRLKVACE